MKLINDNILGWRTMMDILKVILGILIPFFGTTLGASLVIFMKKDLKKQ